MFIIFKDGSTTDLVVKRVEFKDGVVIGYCDDYNAYGNGKERAVAIFSPAHVTAVFESAPFINPPPAPPMPAPAATQLSPPMFHPGPETA